jgi:large subunit ribosomal protein L17
MLRNLTTSVIAHDKCETTVAKAKEVKRLVDKLITLAITDTLANRRAAYSYLTSKDAVQRLFKEVAPRYKTRKGGYTRVVRTRTRHGDAAELAIIALVGQDEGKAQATAQ